MLVLGPGIVPSFIGPSISLLFCFPLYHLLRQQLELGQFHSYNSFLNYTDPTQCECNTFSVSPIYLAIDHPMQYIFSSSLLHCKTWWTAERISPFYRAIGTRSHIFMRRRHFRVRDLDSAMKAGDFRSRYRTILSMFKCSFNMSTS